MSQEPGSTAPYPQPQGWWDGAPGSGPMARPDRPGTVLAAVVVTWLCVAAVAFVALLLLVVACTLGGPILDVFDTGTNPRWYLGGAAAVVVAWCLLAGVLAYHVLRGQPWARVLLAVSAGLSSAVSVVTAPELVPLATLAGSAAVLVLLFLADSNAWFRQRGES